MSAFPPTVPRFVVRTEALCLPDQYRASSLLKSRRRGHDIYRISLAVTSTTYTVLRMAKVLGSDAIVIGNCSSNCQSSLHDESFCLSDCRSCNQISVSSNGISRCCRLRDGLSVLQSSYLATQPIQTARNSEEHSPGLRPSSSSRKSLR